ncbi:hypothetical protein CROQUDRAFT_48848, partial [Cronartium quercuum f. sp. fusiforme G11]
SPVGRGERHRNLYYLPSQVLIFSTTQKLNDSLNRSLLAWHNSLDLVGLKPLKQLLKLHGILSNSMNESDVQHCPTCVQSKMHHLKFSSQLLY